MLPWKLLKCKGSNGALYSISGNKYGLFCPPPPLGPPPVGYLLYISQDQPPPQLFKLHHKPPIVTSIASMIFKHVKTTNCFFL